MTPGISPILAATAFAEQFAALKEEQDKGKDRLAEGRDALDREMATLRAVGKAVGQASKEVEECHEAVAALGLGPGSPGSNDPRAIASLFRRVRNSPTLRRICGMAGRYRRLAQSRQRRKATHGIDDVERSRIGPPPPFDDLVPWSEETDAGVWPDSDPELRLRSDMPVGNQRRPRWGITRGMAVSFGSSESPHRQFYFRRDGHSSGSERLYKMVAVARRFRPAAATIPSEGWAWRLT